MQMADTEGLILRMRTARTWSLPFASIALVAALAACSSTAGGGSPTTTPPPVSTSTAQAPDETEATPEADETTPEAGETTVSQPPAAAGDLVTADFARPATSPGEKIATIEGQGVTVDVYQVGVEKATKDGLFADPDTNKPIIAEGDDIVFVNYVVTNTGDAEILLSNLFVQVRAEYADWPYLGGMDTITDRDLFEKLKVNDEAYLIGGPEAPYRWKPGTSFSYGENFKYQKGSEITFTMELTPSTSGGELDHDNAFEDVTATTSIK